MKKSLVVVALALVFAVNALAQLQTCVAPTRCVDLQWNPSSNATSYNVYRVVGNCMTPLQSLFLLTSVDASVAAAFTDQTVVERRSYCYGVTAKNAAGETVASVASTTAVGVFVPPLPDPPVMKPLPGTFQEATDCGKNVMCGGDITQTARDLAQIDGWQHLSLEEKKPNIVKRAGKYLLTRARSIWHRV